jgi:hypothetical protein
VDPCHSVRLRTPHAVRLQRMAPLPVIANVFRVALDWNTSGGQPVPVNVFHVRSGATQTATEIGVALDTLISDHGGDMFACVHQDYICLGGEITKLDGISASVHFALTTPAGGSATGDHVPNQAGIASFQTGVRGPRGRGRMYLGPTGEAQVANGVLASATRAAMLAGWEGFISDGGSFSPTVKLVVASYVHTDANDVTTVRIDNVVGTQRRRLDAVR